jgi:glutamine amidotransferase
MSTVAVIDYGMGNLHSITKALQQVASADTKIIITDNKAQILAADRVVFPGVGAITNCLLALKKSGLETVIKEVIKQKPLLGICLGMQALLSFSDENKGVKCLDIFTGKVIRFAENLQDEAGEGLKVPHMGWNQVSQKAHPLWKNIADNSRFYFVHSYYASGVDPQSVVATTHYPDALTCAIAKENIFAVQFHPEKSQTAGLQLLRNFLYWDGRCDKG